MKFGQIIVQLMKNVSNMFLVKWRGLQTSLRPVNGFDKMEMESDLLILIRLYLIFFDRPCAHFQNSEEQQIHHSGFFPFVPNAPFFYP